MGSLVTGKKLIELDATVFVIAVVKHSVQM